MIRFGPAGIPLSCKGRTIRDGILHTRGLGLDAIEVQFSLGVEKLSVEDAERFGEVAKELDIEVHVKAPYYTNFAGNDENIERSMAKVLGAGIRGHLMGARTVIVHPGYYGDQTPDEALRKVIKNLRDLRNTFIAQGWTPRIAVEVMGKQNVLGSLDEVLEICRKVKGIIPVIDWGHIHARSNGQLRDEPDFQAVLDQVEALGLDHFLMHFSGITYEDGNSRAKTPISKSDLKFEPLCEILLERDMNVTILSTSPLMEHDAMFMNILLNRTMDNRQKRVQKAEREAEEAKRREDDLQRKAEEADKKRQEQEAEKKRKEEEAAKAKEDLPQCEALTLSGEQCRNSARKGAKYCPTHKGWRGKTIHDLPENQIPVVIQSTEEKRQQVRVDAYKLFKKGERYYFMREKKEGFSVVFKVPENAEIRYNRNGIPTIRMNKD